MSRQLLSRTISSSVLGTRAISGSNAIVVPRHALVFARSLSSNASGIVSVSAASMNTRSIEKSSLIKQFYSTEKKSPKAGGESTSKVDESKKEDTDDAGMDLFAQAMAQQQGKEASSEPLSEEEQARKAEKIRRMKEAIEKEQAAKRAAATRYNVAILLSLFVALYAYLGIETEQDKTQEGESEFAAHQRRVNAQLLSIWKYFTDAPDEKLLPDLLPPGYQPAYTLCIELNDTLVQLVWDKTVGWRAAIRPWAREFLGYLSRYYEIVVFTTTPGHLAEPVVGALDPFGDIRYRLYRDHTKFENNVYIKDISKLNRDPSKVIILDINPESFKNQPENGVLLKPWKGELQDDELKRYLTFFEELFYMMMLFNAKDLRPFLKVIKDIDENDVPGAWDQQKNKWRQDFEERQQSKAQSAASVEKNPPSVIGGILSTVGSIAGQLVGANKSSAESSSGLMKMNKIENVIDTVERAAREEREAYKKEFEARINKKEEIQKEYEEMIRKQMEENKSKNLKLIDYFMGAGQPAPPGAAPSSTAPAQ